MFKQLARKIIFPSKMAAEEEERRLEKLMGFPGQYQSHRRVQMRLLQQRGLLPHHAVLDIGCGPLTLGLPLIQYLDPGGYTGVDVRKLVIEEARNLVVSNGLTAKRPRIILSSSFGTDELGDDRFDVIVSFSVLFHLEDHLATQLLATVAQRLKPAGVFFANVNTQHEPSRWLEFPFLRRDLKFYESLAHHQSLAMEELGTGADFGIPSSDSSRFNHYLAFKKSVADALEV